MRKRKRLGRPPDTTGEETRERILIAARDCFSRFGYNKTTNQDIATAAGITTGAIYHYFDSKPMLFAAVVDGVNRVIFDTFEQVIATEDHFVNRMRALLDAASKLHDEDPTFARFSAIGPIELQRHPEILPLLDPSLARRTARFFSDLAKAAADAGELPADLSPVDVGNMIAAMTIGLAFYGALESNHDEHRGAVVAVERILEMALSPAPERAGRAEPSTGRAGTRRSRRG